MTLSRFLETWIPKQGENHKITYQSLVDDVTDETLTHYYIMLGDINDNPSAVVVNNEIKMFSQSVQLETGLTQFFSDRVYINIDQNANEISLHIFYLDEMTEDSTFNEFLYSKCQQTLKFKIDFNDKSQSLTPFLLKNDSLLIYSSRKTHAEDISSDELNYSGSLSSSLDDQMNSSSDKDAFISLFLFKYKQYDEKEKIKITIGENVLSQIIPDSLPGNSTKLSLFDYRIENDEEVINANISDQIFKNIVPDPLSSNRFFFLAYKVLYLAEIVGNGKKRNLQVFKIHINKPILKFDVSETVICYLTINEDGYYTFESFYRTDDIIPKTYVMDDKIFMTKPDSFFLFNDFIYIKPHNYTPCIWNFRRREVTDIDDDINFYYPVSKDWFAVICTKDDENKIFLRNGSTEIDCNSNYTDDIRIVANSSFLLLIGQYGIKQIDISHKKKKSVNTLYTFNNSLQSIRKVIDNQNKKIDESTNKLNQISNELIQGIQNITKNLCDTK